MALPHIQNSVAGRNKFDPVHTSLFEVIFTVPEALKKHFAKDEVLLTEHVTKISGLDALGKAPETGVQKFMGTDRSYIKPNIDGTRAELSCDFTLNLRNDTDNYIYNLFRAWAALGHDITTGRRALKRDYCAEWLRIRIANRVGDVYQDVIFKDVMMNGPLGGLGEYSYDSGDAAELSDVKFVSDWWEDQRVGAWTWESAK